MYMLVRLRFTSGTVVELPKFNAIADRGMTADREMTEKLLLRCTAANKTHQSLGGSFFIRIHVAPSSRINALKQHTRASTYTHTHTHTRIAESE